MPHKFFNAKYGEPVREVISSGNHLSEIVHFGDEQVFTGATTYTALLFLDRAGNQEFRFVKADDLTAWRTSGETEEGTVPAANATREEWNFVIGRGAELFERLKAMPVKLEDVTDRIFQGIKTSADKIYIVNTLEREEGCVKVYSREKDAEYWLEEDLLHPLVKGGDSRRFHLSRTDRLILFPYASRGGNDATLIPQKTMEASYPLTWTYLLDNKQYLEDRERGKMRGENWYGYGRSQALDVMPLPKIFTPDIAERASYSLDESGEAFFTGGVSGGYGVLVKPGYSQEFVMGLLNSRLLEWYIRNTATWMRGGYYSYESRFIRNLPIRTIDFSEASDAEKHDRMVGLVERMLDLHGKLSEARIERERTVIGHRIAATDREIDRLVYELYGLSEEEIGVVEGSNPR